jgi:hypothetical protein
MENGKSNKKIWNITWCQNGALCNHLSNWTSKNPYFGKFLASLIIPNLFHCFNQAILCSFLTKELSNIWIFQWASQAPGCCHNGLDFPTKTRAQKHDHNQGGVCRKLNSGPSSPTPLPFSSTLVACRRFVTFLGDLFIIKFDSHICCGCKLPLKAPQDFKNY